MLNKIVATTHKIQIKNLNFGQETNICPRTYVQQNFRIFWVGMHFRGSKEGIPNWAIKYKHTGPGTRL